MNVLEAGWRQAGGRPEAGWKQTGSRLEAGWRQAGGRLEADLYVISLIFIDAGCLAGPGCPANLFTKHLSGAKLRHLA